MQRIFFALSAVTRQTIVLIVHMLETITLLMGSV